MDKKAIIIFLLLVALIIINDIVVWLIAKEVIQKDVRNNTTYYEFYSVDSVETLNTESIKESEEKQ